MGAGGSGSSTTKRVPAVPFRVGSTDLPYLQRATDLDGMAVNVVATLIQSLTLIHGGALIAIAIPALTGPFQKVLQSPLFGWTFVGWTFVFFGLGLASVIAAGIVAFFALARRSDESLELSTQDRVGVIKQHLAKYRCQRWIAASLLIVSFIFLVLASGASLYVISTTPPA